MAVALLSGCATKSKHAENDGRAAFNLLGIVKSEPNSYAPTPHTSIKLSSDEVVPTSHYTGDRVTFLWGLVTLKDY